LELPVHEYHDVSVFGLTIFIELVVIVVPETSQKAFCVAAMFSLIELSFGNPPNKVLGNGNGKMHSEMLSLGSGSSLLSSSGKTCYQNQNM